MVNKWNPDFITVKTTCNYAKILVPDDVDWSPYKEYSIGLRLTDLQFEKLQLLGCRSVKKIQKETGDVFYNFGRDTFTKRGSELQALTVVNRFKQPWPVDKAIGDGSEVDVILEYWKYKAGVGYPAGTSFRIAAVMIQKHVIHVPLKIQDDPNILDKFESSPATAPEPVPQPTPETVPEPVAQVDNNPAQQEPTGYFNNDTEII